MPLFTDTKVYPCMRISAMRDVKMMDIPKLFKHAQRKNRNFIVCKLISYATTDFIKMVLKGSTW